VKYSVKQKQDINESKMCKVKRCSRHRQGFSAYCSTHNSARVAYGDPESKRCYPRDYENETRKVKQLMQQNPDHPGVKRGIAFFHDWLELACTRGDALAQKHMLRLNDEQITPESLLLECAALWVFSYAYPWNLPTETALTYALGLCVLCKSSNKQGVISQRNIPSALRRKVGEYIREKLGVLFMNFYTTIRNGEREAEMARKDMGLPLVHQTQE